ncbi:MAG: hypothetical protein INR70_13795 [Parafilimonas terrae]|nr:hypothetical protein [Parafilimonas terrae]
MAANLAGDAARRLTERDRRGRSSGATRLMPLGPAHAPAVATGADRSGRAKDARAAAWNAALVREPLKQCLLAGAGAFSFHAQLHIGA